jgi:predicted amino acid dehydrogenase
VARNLDIAVTTGNSYTVATAIEAAVDGARRMGTALETAKVAVVGATGSIGRTCAHLMAGRVGELSLVGRDIAKLEKVAGEIGNGAGRDSNLATATRVSMSSDIKTGLKDASVVITVTSALDAVILPEHIAVGAVVCDVARPRDVSVRVAAERDDVLVIEGGVVAVPGPDVDFHFNFGFPPKTAYACMSETIALALDNRYESFTLGKDVSVGQVGEITEIARKHGFKLAGYRSFERGVTEEQIETIRRNAAKRKSLGRRAG